MKIKEHEQPLDFYENLTVSVVDWLKDNSDPFHSSEKKLREVVDAYTEVRKLNSDSLRSLPRVGYDKDSDSHYFIFKCDNNGQTYTVSSN